ncbi:hypothetical protein BGZ76_007457 [Entomortierella beljakovae]|nr:hypothetical protein BGZ76_007457 [Entomortierella beljakovae]
MSTDKTENQIAIALRKRSLSFWLSTSKEKPECLIIIPDSKPVTGTFIAMDSQENRVRINKLQTLLGTYDQVVLRGNDIDVLEISL